MPGFKDGTFALFTDKATKQNTTIFVENEIPLVFGNNNDSGIILDGIKPVIVDLNENGTSQNNLWIHDDKDKTKANILVRTFADTSKESFLPRRFGVFFIEDRSCYEEFMVGQINAISDRGEDQELDKIFFGDKT